MSPVWHVKNQILGLYNIQTFYQSVWAKDAVNWKKKRIFFSRLGVCNPVQIQTRSTL